MKKRYLKNIKDLRNDTKVSTIKLAEYLGISEELYMEYESGKKEMPIEIMEELSNLYCQTIDTLYNKNYNKKNNKYMCFDTLTVSDMKELSKFNMIALEYKKMKECENEK